jgi:hypothetical protein
MKIEKEKEVQRLPNQTVSVNLIKSA